jgi:hypothetical protein
MIKSEYGEQERIQYLKALLPYLVSLDLPTSFIGDSRAFQLSLFFTGKGLPLQESQSLSHPPAPKG